MAPRQLIRLGSNLEERLEDELAARLAGYQTDIPKSVIRDPQNKWLASSAWQKAIRRNQPDIARRMVTGLYRLDAAYPWRRLPVIALEDVGAADLPLVAGIMWAAGKQLWRQRHGGDLKVLLYFTERLAAATKDRVACDLEVWTDYDAELHGLRAELAEADRATLVEAVLDGPLEQRHLALRYLAGTRAFPGANLVPGRLGDFMDVVEVGRSLGLNDDVLTIAVLARHRGGSMALSLVLAMWMLQGADTVTVEPDTTLDLPMIGAWPSYALDAHNHQGKRSISYFVKACQPMRDWLDAAGVAPARRAKVVMELLFRAETELLDRRLVYGQSRRVQLMSWYATVNGYAGLPAPLVEEGVLLLRQELPALHHARERIMRGS